MGRALNAQFTRERHRAQRLEREERSEGIFVEAVEAPIWSPGICTQCQAVRARREFEEHVQHLPVE